MIAIGIRINGVLESQKTLASLIDKDELEEVVFRRMIITAGEARMICRDLRAVRTGRLMNSTGGTTTNNGPGKVDSPASESEAVEPPHSKPGVFVTGRVGTNVKYAPYVHDGTMKMVPRPFIDMAMMKNMGPLEDDIRAYLEQQSKEANKK
jgi:hypothetical protein